MLILLIQFLKHKIHLGHNIRNTSLFSSWYLYKQRGAIWIINLYKTIWLVKLVYIYIKFLINSNKSIWFINMDISKQSIIKKYASECGEFACTSIWLRGLFSNYFSIYPVVKKYLSYKYLYKNYKLYNFYLKWFLTRNTWPRAIFISALKNYVIICKEALSLLIPIIGISDTNLKQQYMNFPIPGNDDSYESLLYIGSILSKFILISKYKKVLLWVNYAQTKYKYFLSLDKIFNNKNFNFTKVTLNLIKKYFMIYYNYTKEFRLFKLLSKKIFNFQLNNILSESLSFDFVNIKKFNFYLNLINIGWHKKYLIYKNWWNLQKPFNKYYLIYFFDKSRSRVTFYSRWFFKLYYYISVHYFRNFLDTVVLKNFFTLITIKKFFYGIFFWKFFKIKVKKWFKKWHWKMFIHSSKKFRSNLLKKYLILHLNKYFFNFYLILFIKFFHFNTFSIKLNNIY